MSRKKITTQKVHKVLQSAGFVSSMYKPSAGINSYEKKGIVVVPIFRGEV